MFILLKFVIIIVILCRLYSVIWQARMAQAVSALWFSPLKPSLVWYFMLVAHIKNFIIFIYSCFAQLVSFEIDCFYGLRTRIYEYVPPSPIIELATGLHAGEIYMPSSHRGIAILLSQS